MMYLNKASWSHSLLRSAKKPRSPRAKFRAALEVLEDRTLLNSTPVLSLPQTAFNVVKTTQLSVTVSATDKDSGQVLTFSLVNAPAGAVITTTQVSVPSGSAATGTLTWTPTEDQGPTGYAFTVVVTDDGKPVRSASQAVTVTTLAAGLVDNSQVGLPQAGQSLLLVGTSANLGTASNPGNDTVSVSATAAANTVSATVNGTPFMVPVPANGQIFARLFGGNDSFTLNEGTGSQPVGPPLSVNGGTGSNTVTVNGTTNSDTFTISATTVGLTGAGALSYSNVQTLNVNGQGGNDTFSMTGINPGTATALDGGTGADTYTGTLASAFNGSLTLVNLETATLQVGGDFSGSLTVNSPGNLQSLSVTGVVTSGSTITATNVTNVTLGTLAGTLLAAGGSVNGATITSVASTGLLTATEVDGAPGSGTLSDITIGSVFGNVFGGSIVNATFGLVAEGASVKAAGQGTTSNVSIGTLSGSFSAPEDSNAGSGVMSNTTINSITSTGTVSTGSISGMTVGTADSGSSITAAGQGTTSNVSIGTLSGSFSAPEDSNAGSGVMSNTTINSITSTGTVSTGSISGMTVGTAASGSSITAAGQGTTSNVSIGTLSGSFSAPEDSNAGSGVMSNTTIGTVTSSGSVSTGSISGMSVGSNAGSITAAGQGTTSNVSIGTLSGSFSAPEDSNAGSGVMSNTTINSITSTGTVSTGSISGMTVGTADSGSSITAAGQGTISNVSLLNLAGSLTAEQDSTPGSGALSDIVIGTLATTGKVQGATASNVTIGVDGGTVNVSGTLTSLFIGTVLPTANFSAGHFNLVTAQHTSPIVNFIEPTVTRGLSVTPHTAGDAVPDYGFYYDGTGPGNPRVVIQIAVASPVNFDLGVTTSTTTASPTGFDLAGLYASTANVATGIHNVVVGGDVLLNAVPAGALVFFNLPSNTSGGVQLPRDRLAVAAAGTLPAASIVAQSVVAVAAGSFAGVSADEAANTDALVPLAPGTDIDQANDTFQVFVSTANHVAQFLVTGPGGSFDSKPMLFAQLNTTASVPAPVTVTETLVPAGSSTTVQSVVFTGQGGSLTTAQPITASIRANPGGSLGNLILSAPQGIAADITADSITGNIDATNGGIAGTIKTTAGDLGRAFTDASGTITGVTFVHAGGGGLTGKILVKGNLVSQLNLQSGLDGVVAADGDLGVIQTKNGIAVTNPDGSLIRFGGLVVSNGGLNGQVIVLGNAFGDISLTGGLGGRIAVRGNPGEFGLAPSRFGILGNVSIGGGISTTGAIVSSGLIGDDGTNNINNDVKGTHLTISGNSKGILAAGEDINFGTTGSLSQASVFEDAKGSNQAAIDAIFTDNGFALDVTNAAQLNLLLQDLLALTVVNGKLTGTTP
jgi:hypothetical protein